MSIYRSTNVWFGKGCVVSSDPVGDGRHFNRDDYGIWFTILYYIYLSIYSGVAEFILIINSGVSILANLGELNYMHSMLKMTTLIILINNI